jgi:hypothetical protein
MFWIGLLVGLFIGGTVGVLAMACCVVSGNADRNIENEIWIRKAEPRQV